MGACRVGRAYGSFGGRKRGKRSRLEDSGLLKSGDGPLKGSPGDLKRDRDRPQTI